MRSSLLLLFSAASTLAAQSRPDLWVEYTGGAGPGAGKSVVLVSGDEEYRSEEALPMLGKILAERHGFDCRVVFAIDPRTGEINGDVQTNIPGLEALATADLMVIATRFRDLPDEQMRHIDAYLRSGKPVLGIRTATHAFALRSSQTYAHYAWNHDGADFEQGFGRQVLGETWIAHHGQHGRESTRGVVPESAKGHPITRGLEPGSVWGPTDVYRVRLPLPDGCEPIVLGQVLAGMAHDSEPVEGAKNDPMMPIAWTKTHDGSGFGPRRVFTQTIGAATDFVAPGTRRLFVNAAYWLLGLEDQIPDGGTDVALVGEYEPTDYGFGGARTGVRPSHHALDFERVPADRGGPIRAGGRVVVAGNTFAERLAQSGYLDAVLHATHPEHDLVIRHVPWSGDEVDLRPREHSVPRMLQWLGRLEADVVMLCFGMSESFAQTPARFEQGLRKLLDDVSRVGAKSPRTILVSPIAHEGNDETVAAHNLALGDLADVMERVARERDLEFVDLFGVATRAYEASGRVLTTNGIHPSEAGCGMFAAAIARQLGWVDADDVEASDRDAAALQALRSRAADQHWLFRLRYRPTNTEYVWGRRHRPFGIVNFPPEAAQLDRMIAARDREIWKLDVPDARAVARLALTAPEVWPTTPSRHRVPEDDWEPVTVEAKGTETSLGSTDIDAPAEFARSFTLAAGYVADCFASEQDFPGLANPLAMTFDAQWRLWVLCAPTYPHLLPGDRPRCQLIVLEDEDGDGRADRSTVFADELYIPTGFAVDVDAVYLGQAPDLLRLTDMDGDGRCDKTEVIFSGFGMCDSHHQLSAFEWDPSGGVIMHEGVFTKTNVETPHGTRRTTGAGVFRYDPLRGRLDVLSHCNFSNPWGHVFDDFGASILADASGGDNHSFTHVCAPYEYPTKPARPGPVSNRGRPTAGCELLASRHFPDDVQGSFLVNQSIGFHGTRWDRMTPSGSTWKAEAMPADILSCSDLNFRPVAIETGPDGALYVLDWCNPIVGHMQYSVRDPRRDHSHGRVWRIRHESRPLVERVDVHRASINELFEMLRLPERNTRQLARRRLQRLSWASLEARLAKWRERIAVDDPLRERLWLEELWILHAHARASLGAIERVLGATDPRVRAGAVRVLRQQVRAREDDLEGAAALVQRASQDADMRVRLEAVVTCGFLPSALGVRVLEACKGREMDDPMRKVFDAVVKHLGRGATAESGLLARVRLMQMNAAELADLELDHAVATVLLSRSDTETAERRAALAYLAGSDGDDYAETLVEVAARVTDARALEALSQIAVTMPAGAFGGSLAAAREFAAGANVHRAVLGTVMLLHTGAADAAFEHVAHVPGALALFEEGDMPSSVVDRLRRAVDAGSVEPMAATIEIARHANDMAATMEWLVERARAVQGVAFDRWSADHERAMAAMRALSSFTRMPTAAPDAAVDELRRPVASGAGLAVGREIYLDEARGCVRCHGEHGEGLPGFPALDRSPWLLGHPERAASIVVHGVYGPFEMPDGQAFHAAMEPLGGVLDDEQVAAVLTYARQSWGNFTAPVDAATVARARQAQPPGGGMWEVSALEAQYPLGDDVLVEGEAEVGRERSTTWVAIGAALFMMFFIVWMQRRRSA